MRSGSTRFRGLLVVALLVIAAVATPMANASATSGPTSSGSYVALNPARLLDTRYGIGAPAAPVRTNGTVSLQVTGRGGVPAIGSPGGVSAVVLNVTVTAPKAAGWVTVYPDGTSQPGTSNLNYLTGQTVPNVVVAPVGADGKVNLAVTGSTHLLADVSGYFLAGSPAVAGAFGALNPARLLDTRYGIGAPAAPVRTGGTVSLQVTGRGGVPASGVSAVVLNVTVTAPKAAGWVTVYPDGTSKPNASNLNYLAGQTVPNVVVAPVGADGKVDLAVTGSTHLLADVAGYFLAGSPAVAGAFGALNPARLLDTRNGIGAPAAPVRTNGTVSLQVTGRGGVPTTGVSAVVLNVTVTAPKAAGWVTVYPDGTSQPGTSNLNYLAGQTVPNVVVAPVGADGKVNLAVTGSTHLLADVSGYMRSTDIGPATTSTSRYVRNINGNSGDTATMHSEGCADATSNGSAGNHLMLLDIGAQTIRNLPLSSANPGVALSGTYPVVRISDAQLVTAVNAYVDGYVGCRTGSTTSTIVVGTNNDGDWAGYLAAARGTDWATKVIEPVRSHASADAGIVIAGGDDIEAGFASSEQDAETWITSYLNASPATSRELVEHGSADNCPTAAGQIDRACGAVLDDNNVSKTWTQLQYYRLAHALSPSRIIALPQIYYTSQAAQWANIDQTGATSSDKINFVGALTEHAACDASSGACSSLTPEQGFAALWDALSQGTYTTPALTVATDLESDT